MKNIIIYAVMFFSAFGFAQSIEGDWYSINDNTIGRLTVKNDTIIIYNGFVEPDSINMVVDKIYTVLSQEERGNKQVYNVKKKRSEKIIKLIIEHKEENYHQLLISVIDEKDSNAGIIPLPLRFISNNELKSYTLLKDAFAITEADFIVFAKNIIALKDEYLAGPGSSRGYFLTEVQYSLAQLGYNPLIIMDDFYKSLSNRFKNNPEIKELFETLKSVVIKS